MIVGTGTGNGGSWHGVGSWISDNTDRFLLLFLVLLLVCVDIYILNRTTDAQIQFVNGMANMALGALINQVTGSKPKGASATSTSKEDPLTGKTTDTLKIESEKGK